VSLLDSPALEDTPPAFDAGRFVARRDVYVQRECRLRDEIAALDRRAAQVPDFMIIGAPRTGTTFLFALLAETDRIHLPPEKELKFFSAYMAKWDLAAYLEQFRGGRGKILGEASPSYAVLPKSRIELIRELNPAMKVIYMLRDPASRAASEWKHNRRQEPGWTEAELMSFVASDGVLMQADYAANLQRWLEVFAPDQIKVIFYESFSRSPELAFRQSLDFLDAGQVDLPSKSFMVPHNATWEAPDLQTAIDRVAPYLYGARTRRLRSILSDVYPSLERPSWVETAQVPVHPKAVVLYDLDATRSLGVTAEGDFLCGSRADLDRVAAQGEPTLAVVRDLGLGFGRFTSEAIAHAMMVDGIADWKLYASCNGDRWSGDFFLVREAYFGWHIYSYRGVFYSIRDRAGMVDLRRAPVEELRGLSDAGDLLEFEALEPALEHAASDWKSTRLPAPPGSGSERIGPMRAAAIWMRRLPCRAVRGLAYRAVWMMRSLLEPETLRRTLNGIARWCNG